MRYSSFDRFSGAMALAAGIAGFLYALSFIILRNVLLSALFLTVVGFVTTAVVVALYYRVRLPDPGFALWGLILGLVGAVGSAIHGGYDLANSINPPATALPNAFSALPSQVDPRGLLTFGSMSVSLWVFSWLIARSNTFPRFVGYLGFFSSILLIILYLARLTILDPSNPLILVPAVVNGFIVSPLFYFMLGVALWRKQEMVPEWTGPERRRVVRAG